MLLPSNSKMALLPKRYLQQHNYQHLLANQLKQVRRYFDYILIDTPPLIEFFTLNGLLASNLAIITVQCNMLAMDGAAQLENFITAINRKMHQKVDYRVLATFLDQTETASQVVYNKMRQQYPERLFQTAIAKDAKIPESQIMKRPVIQFAANSPSALQYMALADEVEALEIQTESDTEPNS
jgi:chromosome partitioning protein